MFQVKKRILTHVTISSHEPGEKNTQIIIECKLPYNRNLLNGTLRVRCAA